MTDPAGNPSSEPLEPELRRELLARADRDQAARYAYVDTVGRGRPDWSPVAAVDADNLAFLAPQLEQHGWLGSDLVGVDGAHACSRIGSTPITAARRPTAPSTPGTAMDAPDSGRSPTPEGSMNAALHSTSHRSTKPPSPARGPWPSWLNSATSSNRPAEASVPRRTPHPTAAVAM